MRKYVLDLGRVVQHVALGLEAAGGAASISGLAATYHPDPPDLQRVMANEKVVNEDAAVELMVERAVDGLGQQVVRDGDNVSFANGTKFDDLFWKGQPVLRPAPDECALLGDLFNTDKRGSLPGGNIRTEKHHNLDELRWSLKTYGWLEGHPAVREDGDDRRLLTGHNRVAIAKELGIEPEYVDIPSLGCGDEADKKRIRIALGSQLGFDALSKKNKAQISHRLHLEGWDPEQIAEVLKENLHTVKRDIRLAPLAAEFGWELAERMWPYDNHRNKSSCIERALALREGREKYEKSRPELKKLSVIRSHKAKGHVLTSQISPACQTFAEFISGVVNQHPKYLLELCRDADFPRIRELINTPLDNIDELHALRPLFKSDPTKANDCIDRAIRGEEVSLVKEKKRAAATQNKMTEPLPDTCRPATKEELKAKGLSEKSERRIIPETGETISKVEAMRRETASLAKEEERREAALRASPHHDLSAFPKGEQLERAVDMIRHLQAELARVEAELATCRALRGVRK